MKAFLHFIRQDYSFLFHYARTNALAAYKAKNFDDLAASTFIVKTVLDEVKLHIQVRFNSFCSIFAACSADNLISSASHRESPRRCSKAQKKASRT